MLFQSKPGPASAPCIFSCIAILLVYPHAVYAEPVNPRLLPSHWQEGISIPRYPARSSSAPAQHPDPLHENLPSLEIKSQHLEALDAMRAGDYAIAYFLWRPLAEEGDANAQFSLGWMYHNGYGLAINNQKALMWWQRAADQKLASASFALGMLFSHGDRKIARDRPAALQHYLTAATLGHDDAKEMILHLIQESKNKDDGLDDIIGNWDKQEWQLIGTTLRVTAARANVRNGPGTDHAVVAVLREDDEVIQISSRKHWLEVFLPDNGMIAWLHDSLVKTKDGAKVNSIIKEKPTTIPYSAAGK